MPKRGQGVDLIIVNGEATRDASQFQHPSHFGGHVQKHDTSAGSRGRALAQAEPEGYVQVFLDEGEPLAALLRWLVSPGVARAYARRLLEALDRTTPKQEPTAPPGPSPLIEPLTEREIEVVLAENAHPFEGASLRKGNSLSCWS